MFPNALLQTFECSYSLLCWSFTPVSTPRSPERNNKLHANTKALLSVRFWTQTQHSKSPGKIFFENKFFFPLPCRLAVWLNLWMIYGVRHQVIKLNYSYSQGPPLYKTSRPSLLPSTLFIARKYIYAAILPRLSGKEQMPRHLHVPTKEGVRYLMKWVKLKGQRSKLKRNLLGRLVEDGHSSYSVKCAGLLNFPAISRPQLSKIQNVST